MPRHVENKKKNYAAERAETALDADAYSDPMMAEQTPLMTRAELLDAVGLTKGGLDLWQAQGCPYFKLHPHEVKVRGRRAQILYDLDAVNAWRVNRGWKTHELKSERRTFDQALFAIVEEQAPMTVRQAYYRAVVSHLVSKTDEGYDKVKKGLTKMRLATIADDNGDKFDEETPRLPLEWLVDNGRVVYDRNSFTSPAAALAHAARKYTRAYWTDRNTRVYVWLEKDALASVISPVAAEFDVPLMVARGINSISFIYRVAEMIRKHDCPTTILYFRDLDPTGLVAPGAVQEMLDKLLSDGPKVKVEELAITMDQVREHKLEETAQPTKKENTHFPNFARVYGKDHPSFELDALEPRILRKIVRDAIKAHVSDEEHEEARAAEREDRELIADLVDGGPTDFAWDPVTDDMRHEWMVAETNKRKAEQDAEDDRFLAECDAAREAASSKPRTVSLMITAAQKIELRARGYTDEQIRNLTPTEAHRILDL